MPPLPTATSIATPTYPAHSVMLDITSQVQEYPALLTTAQPLLGAVSATPPPPASTVILVTNSMRIGLLAPRSPVQRAAATFAQVPQQTNATVALSHTMSPIPILVASAQQACLTAKCAHTNPAACNATPA